MKVITIDNQKYITPSWEDMGNLCFDLSQKILSENGKYDRLIALVKGGLTWSRTLLDYLQIEHLSAFQVKFYQDIKKTDQKAVIVQSLPVVVEGESVLLFDDVVDSGETLDTAKQYLKMCGAKNITAASLFIKPWAKEKSDFYAENTDAWIIFPCEIRETITLLSKKWSSKNLTRKQVEEKLLQLNISQKEINLFLNLKGVNNVNN